VNYREKVIAAMLFNTAKFAPLDTLPLPDFNDNREVLMYDFHRSCAEFKNFSYQWNILHPDFEKDCTDWIKGVYMHKAKK